MFGCYHRSKMENQMPEMTLRNITEACSGTYVGSLESMSDTVAGVVIDSRQVKQDYLFIPIKGEKVDGHKFIPDVFEKGGRKRKNGNSTFHALRANKAFMEQNSN